MSKITDYTAIIENTPDKKDIYRLMIVDDEYWVREELIGMIDWERYLIALMPPAGDGEEALKLMEGNTPDILITDVNMPFMNGVELAARVRSLYPEVVVIMLSGYDDFKYVKDSLLAGAIDYLMKPVSKVELIKVLTQAMDIINSRIIEKNDREIERKRLLRATSSLNDREYSSIMQQGAINRGSMSLNFSAATGMNIPDGGFATMLIKIHGLNSLADVFHYDMNLLSYAIKQRIEDTGIKPLLIYNNIYSTSEFVLLINGSPKELNSYAMTELNALSEFTERTISIGVSNIYFSEHDMYASYTEAKNALMLRDFGSGNVVNAATQVSDKRSLEDKALSSLNDQNLLRLIRSSSEGLNDYIFNTLGLSRAVEDGWTLYRTQGTVRFILRCINSAAIDAGNELDVLNDSIMYAVENMENEEMLNLMKLIIEQVSGSSDGASEATSAQDMVPEIASYIKENYFENISLSTLSEKYHIESTYLSKIFKKETGDTLMNYIASTRIAKAKELIDESDISLTEIAFLCGYDDYTYFNKVFRKFEGCSPRDYRSREK